MYVMIYNNRKCKALLFQEMSGKILCITSQKINKRENINFTVRFFSHDSGIQH
jgi:hypothetical protein